MTKVFLSLLLLLSFQVHADPLLDLLSQLTIATEGPKIECDKTVEKTTLTDTSGKTFPVSSISLEYLQELFNELASNPEIPFKYPEDGCYSRAHEMSRILESKGIITGKAFIEGNLKVYTPNSPKGWVEWWYHVAPVVMVKIDGKDVPYIIDPSIFSKPVPADDWYNIQTIPTDVRTTYYTNRFIYQPDNKSLELTSFREEDLKDTQETMKKYSQVVEDRKKEAHESSIIFKPFKFQFCESCPGVQGAD